MPIDPIVVNFTIIQNILVSIFWFFIGKRLGSSTSWLSFIPYVNVLYVATLAGFSIGKAILNFIIIPTVGVGIMAMGIYGGYGTYIGAAVIIISLFSLIIASFCRISHRMGKSYALGVLGVIPGVMILYFGWLAFGPYKLLGKKKSIKLSEEDLKIVLLDCIDKGMTNDQIIEFAKNEDIDVLEVKRALYSLRRGGL